MDSDNFIGVWDNVLTEEECGMLISHFESLSQNAFLSKANANNMEGTEQFPNGALGRKDFSIFFDQVVPKYSKFIHDKLGQCMEEYVQTYPGLQHMGLISHTCKVQKTPPKGGFHVWHCEHGPDVTSYRRVAVWIVYLSTHENDGETEFLQQGIRVAPEAGRVVIWPAGFTHPHRGNPVYDKDKYIATGWFEFYQPPYGSEG